MIEVTGWYRTAANKAKRRTVSADVHGFRYGAPGPRAGPYASISFIEAQTGDRLYVSLSAQDFERFAAQVSAATVVMTDDTKEALLAWDTETRSMLEGGQ